MLPGIRSNFGQKNWVTSFFFENFFPFFKIFCILWNTPEQVARDRKKCFWYHISWSGKLLYAWQSQNIGLCILKDPYHFGKKGSLRSCSELPELSVIFSRPIMWLVRVFLLTTNTIWIVVLLVKYMSVFYKEIQQSLI